MGPFGVPFHLYIESGAVVWKSRKDEWVAAYAPVKDAFEALCLSAIAVLSLKYACSVT